MFLQYFGLSIDRSSRTDLVWPASPFNMYSSLRNILKEKTKVTIIVKLMNKELCRPYECVQWKIYFLENLLHLYTFVWLFNLFNKLLNYYECSRINISLFKFKKYIYFANAIMTFQLSMWWEKVQAR
jgi:hypothetical protein